MNLKKFALRGLIGTIVTAALCMFFSGTIESITTPKVRIIRPSRGKLTWRVELEAKLAYPDAEEGRVRLPAGRTLTIEKVNARAGESVAAGDVLFEASVTGYEDARAQAQGERDAALDERMEVDRENEGLALRRSEREYADAYAALREAARASAERRTDMEVLLREANLCYTDADYPPGADGELRSAIDAYRAALAARDAAQAEFDRAARYGISDAAWAYISARQAAREKLEDCEERLVDLEELRRSAAEIRAPHDGVIASVSLKAGEIYDGAGALYAITAEGAAPALRANIDELEQSVTVGMKVALPGGAQAAVTGLGFDDAGARYCDVAVTEEVIQSEGGLLKLAQGGAKLALSFTARESGDLLPASAVRGSGDHRYVYVVNERATAFGEEKLFISRMDVTLIAEADGTASVAEDLSGRGIAYMEDRALSDGAEVMRDAR